MKKLLVILLASLLLFSFVSCEEEPEATSDDSVAYVSTCIGIVCSEMYDYLMNGEDVIGDLGVGVYFTHNGTTFDVTPAGTSVHYTAAPGLNPGELVITAPERAIPLYGTVPACNVLVYLTNEDPYYLDDQYVVTSSDSYANVFQVTTSSDPLVDSVYEVTINGLSFNAGSQVKDLVSVTLGHGRLTVTNYKNNDSKYEFHLKDSNDVQIDVVMLEQKFNTSIQSATFDGKDIKDALQAFFDEMEPDVL